MSPCPGKCFPTGRTPPARHPFAKATPSRATDSASPEKARSPITGLRGLLSTSRTGAKSTSTPTARSSAAVAAPTAAATSSFRQQKRAQARAGGNQVKGGSFRRATRPPSWSTAISGAGFPLPEAERISRHSDRSCDGFSTFRAYRTTPPASPAARRLASVGGTDFPSKPSQRGDATVSLPIFMMRRIYHGCWQGTPFRGTLFPCWRRTLFPSIPGSESGSKSVPLTAAFMGRPPLRPLRRAGRPRRS